MLNFLFVPFIFAKNSNSLSPDNPIGKPFIRLEEVDSTNNYAMGQAQAHLAGHGTTWFANHQIQGKGQRGKQWLAQAGDSIIMSCLVKPNNAAIDHPFLLSATAALACFDFFSSYAGDETAVKWPNDLYWRNRKAGGILIENVWQAGIWKFAIIGIGININQGSFHANIPNPVSLKQITGKQNDTQAMAKQLCLLLEKRWEDLENRNADEIMAAFNQALYKRDEKAHFKKDNAAMEAIVSGVNIKGELLIETGNEITAIPFGEVEWIIS